MAWRRSDEQLAPEITNATDTPEHIYVGYWGAISGQVLGPITIVPHGTTINTDSYKEIMEQHMIPYYKSLSGRVIFQQDGTRYHTAKSVLSFLEEQGVEVMEWPAKSLDLNPMVNVWHLLNLRIDKRMGFIHSYRQLEQVVHPEWDKIDFKEILDCIDRMPQRCKEVIKNNGGYSGH